ncbi:MAG: DinB family protein [Rhodothermales bacterium]|nr:DinB family protein [Rhodothermales bacterium]
MTRNAALRRHLADALAWRSAHATFDDAVDGLPAALRGQRPDGLPHSPWELVEHLRRAQRDILDFCLDPDYETPEWPAAYWPPAPAPPDAAAWDAALGAFRDDLAAMQRLVLDPATDLFAPIPHGDGQTILREALLLADHNAYHVGQLVAVRQALGCWKGVL